MFSRCIMLLKQSSFISFLEDIKNVLNYNEGVQKGKLFK